MGVVVDTPRVTTDLVNANGQPLCGAKKGKGGVCRAIAKANGKCRIHGGNSLSGPDHPAFQDGKHSKHFYLPPILKARTENLTYDAIGNLEESIKTQMAIETQLSEKLETGESPAAWERMAKILASIGPGENDLTPLEAISEIERVVDGALGEQSLRREIQSVHETQRKLSESVSKIRKEMQETYTKEQWDAMMNVLGNLLLRLFPDANLLGQFYRELSSMAQREPKRIGGTARP